MKCPLHSGELIRISWDVYVCIPNQWYVPHIHEVTTKEAERQ